MSKLPATKPFFGHTLITYFTPSKHVVPIWFWTFTDFLWFAFAVVHHPKILWCILCMIIHDCYYSWPTPLVLHVYGLLCHTRLKLAVRELSPVRHTRCLVSRLNVDSPRLKTGIWSWDMDKCRPPSLTSKPRGLPLSCPSALSFESFLSNEVPTIPHHMPWRASLARRSVKGALIDGSGIL